MKRMLAAVIALGLFSGAAIVGAQDAKPMKYNGVIVDAKCGKGDEAAAAKHPAACALKCANGGEKIVLKAGDKTYTLDEKGQTLAKDFLEKEKKTKVVIEGTLKGETLMATSIKAQEEKAS